MTESREASTSRLTSPEITEWLERVSRPKFFKHPWRFLCWEMEAQKIANRCATGPDFRLLQGPKR